MQNDSQQKTCQANVGMGGEMGQGRVELGQIEGRTKEERVDEVWEGGRFSSSQILNPYAVLILPSGLCRPAFAILLAQDRVEASVAQMLTHGIAYVVALPRGYGLPPLQDAA